MVMADDRGVLKVAGPLVHFQLELNTSDLIIKTNIRPLIVIYNEVGVVLYIVMSNNTCMSRIGHY